MKFTFHKWVLNVIAVPNPTQTSKLDKYMLKITISKLVGNSSKIIAYFVLGMLIVLDCYWLPVGCINVTSMCRFTQPLLCSLFTSSVCMRSTVCTYAISHSTLTRRDQ